MHQDKVKSFLEQIKKWAGTIPDLHALALVGSHARGEAKPESDLDLILIFNNPEDYIYNQDWIVEFGSPSLVIKENWGKVTSLRVFYTDGLEVEFGLTNPDWGANPYDTGDARVINDGLVILHEKDSHLSNKVEAMF